MPETAPAKLPIGTDLNLLLDAARAVVTGRVPSARSLQRRVRCGGVKAGRLLLLLEQEGAIRRNGSGWEKSVQRPGLAAILERIRASADSEKADHA